MVTYEVLQNAEETAKFLEELKRKGYNLKMCLLGIIPNISGNVTVFYNYDKDLERSKNGEVLL